MEESEKMNLRELPALIAEGQRKTAIALRPLPFYKKTLRRFHLFFSLFPHVVLMDYWIEDLEWWIKELEKVKK